MEVRAETIGSTVVLGLEGRLTVEEDAQGLHEAVRSIARLSPSDIVLDLGHVRQIDCSGIGQLLRVRDRVRESGASLALVNVDHQQRRLLKMFGLLGVFEVFDSRQDAVRMTGAAGGESCSTLPGWPERSPQMTCQAIDVALGRAC